MPTYTVYDTIQFLFDVFDDSYDPTLTPDPNSSLVDIKGTLVRVQLETPALNFYRQESELEYHIRPADGIVWVMTPQRPSAMDETVGLRYGMMNKAIEARSGGLAEGVVIVKEIDVSWDTRVTTHGQPQLMADNTDAEERARREEEWRVGVDRGYELAKRLGVEAKVACPRTGEGVKEAFEGLVLQILERRKVAGEEARRLEEARLAEEKRSRSYSSRLKKFLRGTKNKK
ncbi:hypothetical protein IMZ48_37215 [Candidatus Bathyarchaeota archaeon]|nr:hypothetical protein [Candidatus Bathyarchaeota archaeon]